jgi:F-type H+-transporting ATPase subunit delta
VKGRAVAGRYARALFDAALRLAGDAKADPDDFLLEMHRQLSALDEAITDNAGLGALLRSPVVAGAEKCRVLDEVARLALPGAGRPAHTIVADFCGLLVEKGRLPLLGLIVQALAARLDARQGVVRGTLHTAVDLDAPRREAIRARLETGLGGSLVLDCRVDPSILGGVVVRFGDRVLDASLRKQLDLLRETIKKGE